MKINGFQKLTLLDFPTKVAATIFTPGCNFRCPFCHNAALVTHLDETTYLDENEVLAYLKKRQGVIEGVCITGGEPLLQPDLKDFILKIREMGYLVKLDTNGYCPDKLISFVSEGLVDYVAMDIKNSKEKYALTAGVSDLELFNIEKSVRYLLEGHVDFEFRTTIVKEYHTPDDVLDIVKWIQGTPKYFLQNFVDSGDLIVQNLNPVSLDLLRKMEVLAKEFVPQTTIRGI